MSVEIQARQAGLREIQPGIESMSRSALKRMRKGVTPLQNVQLLKWCKQFGILPIWYYLYGMPGELPGEYEEGLRILEAIPHLTPPARISRVRIDRYSLLQMRPEDYGLRNLRPSPMYDLVYAGLDKSAIPGLAYYFNAEFEAEEAIASRSAGLQAAVTRWAEAAESAALFSFDEPGRFVVCDLRPQAMKPVYSLSGLERRVYEACEEIRSRAALKERLRAETGAEMTEGDMDEVLKPLLEARLLLEEKDQLLSLAIPLGFDYFPPEPVWSRLPEILKAL